MGVANGFVRLFGSGLGHVQLIMCDRPIQANLLVRTNLLVGI